MARIVNEQEYARKREEILNASLKLVYTIGYEQMTIQDILNEVQMSKGAFYHYFKSKPDLLESLITHMIKGVTEILQPIVEDKTLTGLEKMNVYFEKTVTWKTAHKSFFLELIRIWYSDNNAIIRLKSEDATIKIAAPILNQIIAQAVLEGSMHTDYPELGAEMIFTIFMGLGKTMVDNILSPEPDTDFVRILAAYTSAIERVLGVLPGQIKFLDPKIMDEWRVHPPQQIS
jgi:AcrR family transcriptional regulator